MDFRVNRLSKDCQEIVYDEIIEREILDHREAINMAARMLEAAEMLLSNAKLDDESDTCGELAKDLNKSYGGGKHE